MNTTRIAALLVCFSVSSVACLDDGQPLPNGDEPTASAAPDAQVVAPSERGFAATPTIDPPGIPDCRPLDAYQVLVVGPECDGHPGCVTCLTETPDLRSIGTVSDCRVAGTNNACVGHCAECDAAAKAPQPPQSPSP